ncbi:sensor histidine kinase [Hyalangium gracile]|uniref:sensor histidine kinase n=1 Tax=Hyalangium gracile TaxID=394092 RepID=UPI001CCE70D6|nr:HAMP domain-containing sensor histidine kinase [Hyalangium gracile]
MPSTSSQGGGPEQPGARVPSETHSWRILPWLDGFLSEALRRAPPAELGRARVVAGTTIALIVLAGLILITTLSGELPAGYVVGTTGTLVGYAGILWILRGASSSRLPALLLSALMASTILLVSLHEGDSFLAASAAMMLVTILSEYLLGPRLGLVILIPVLLIVGVVCPLWIQFRDAEPLVMTNGHRWGIHIIAALCILAGWAVGGLYSSAHASTRAALERDIQARKEAEAKLGELHRTLLDVSRQAGMTEIATGVLHNVGNTLNSLNISVGIVTDRLRGSRISMLSHVSGLLNEHAADLASFLTTDPRGSKLPIYISALSTQLASEREALLEEMRALNQSVEHIKSIVLMQQEHARYGGLVERILVPQLIDDALRLDASSFEQLGIVVWRDYAEVPSIEVDRHKLLQILLNLLSNARHALVESDAPDKSLMIRVGLDEKGEKLRIEVGDNGVGIETENLTRIFSQGFTTKKTGHGFGLHISALAAQELRGRLYVASAGRGHGATFTIELPLQSEEPAR